MELSASTLDSTTLRLSLSECFDDEYRARLFMVYNGYQSYCGDAGVGLTVDSDGVSYDDWSSAFRPPRIDAHKFNTEIIVPLTEGDNDVVFSNPIDVSSESFVRSAVNPSNILVERKLYDLTIRRIYASTDMVIVAFDEDIPDGTAVTIGNALLGPRHLLGTDGLRICGTYRVYKVADKIYRYTVKHYIDSKVNVEIDPAGYTASVWESVYYSSPVTLKRLDSTTASFNSAGISAGDYVYINNNVYKVAEKNESIAMVKMPMNTNTSRVTMYYSPHVPSLAVAVNWAEVSTTRSRSAGGMTRLRNSSSYDHTTNTLTLTPAVDTYFINSESDVNHDGEPILMCRGGSEEAVICVRFAPNSIKATETSTAKLSMFVEYMDYSSATITLYQMDSSGWSTLMSYDDIMRHVSNIPIGVAELTNPALKHNNMSDNTPDVGDYGCTIEIELDSTVITEWLSGTSSYTPSFAIRIAGNSASTVKFASTNSTDPGKVPSITFTGGESETPDPFDIELSSQTIEPGQVLRITPRYPAVNDFGNSIFANTVMIGTATAPIISGNSSYIDVMIPDTISGSFPVVIYRNISQSQRVPITNENAYVYVSLDGEQRNVKLADKIKPGIRDVDKMGHTAVYNRDFGFVDMAEVTDENSMLQNVYSILLTHPGERLFSQDFGTGIEERLFKLGSAEEGISLLSECIQKVNKYEPRVTIDGDQSSCEFDNSENRFVLILCVVLPSGNVKQIKLPFKNRGSFI